MKHRNREVDGISEGGSLDRYLRSIGSIPVLTPEQVTELARTMERQERIFRDALYAIPATAAAVLERWRERRRRGLVTGALCARFRDGSGRDWNRHVDGVLGRLEGLVRERERCAGKRSRAAQRSTAELDARIARALRRADLALERLLEIHRGLRAGAADPEVREALARAELALERLEAAKQTLVTHNLRLVVKQARRFRNMGVPFLDLLQEGNLGLIRAAEKFDYRLGFRFSTYAVWWIEQALVRSIQNDSRTVRVPSHIYELQFRSRRVESELRQRLGGTPLRDELARALGVDADAVDRAVASSRPILSTQAPMPGGEEFTLEEALADEDAPDPLDAIDRATVQETIGRRVAALGARERQVLAWRFGLGGEEPLTLEAIGQRLGLSRERVRQIQQRALAVLREQEEILRLASSLEIGAGAA